MQDITNKLTDLMWHDWHSEVRRASAQCLGKTGHGRDVHDDLRKRILEGDERIKLEALSKVGQLGMYFILGFQNRAIFIIDYRN